MNSLNIVNRQVGRVLLALGLLFASIAPALLPSFAGAAQVTTRSIALSSSTADASGVNYKVTFTAPTAAGAILLNFCSDSPLLGSTCTPPTGFTVASATTSSSGYTITNKSTANIIRLTKTINAGDTVTFDLANMHNPTATGPLYARILTYANDTDAAGYTASNPDAVGTHKDDGGVAMSITNQIGVSAAVLESLVFCVSGENASHANPITANCGGTLVAPTLKLGTDNGGVIALDSSNVYSAPVYTQISTNAASGAVVSLKSSALGCGGLIRAGASSASVGCGIAPALASDISAGEAKFGVKTSTATGGSGTLQPYGTLATTPYYSDSTYKMNYVSGDGTGVTSTYGDPFLETAGAPVNNKTMALTFGASAANNTPAGNYSANLSLIATGTF